MSSEQGELVRFYRNEAPDDMGRSLEAILSWDDERLELYHDFIQWLFPLRERSGANPTAPVLTDEDVEVFRSDPTIRVNMTRSFNRMMMFYGIGIGPDGALDKLTSSDLFLIKKDSWLNHANHNYLPDYPSPASTMMTR